MAIFSRIFRLCKADLHGVMDQMEDKGLLLKQYLREMEAALKQKQERQSQLHQSCRQIEGDLSQRREEVAKMEKDLDLAVRKEKDDIAKMLIRKRRTIQAGCQGLQRQLQALEEEKKELAELLDQQQMQYQELKAKAAVFCRQTERRRFEEAFEMTDGSAGAQTTSEEEIELELLQRKEALKQGGVQ